MSDSENEIIYSDDENQELTWESAKRFKLVFGKYSGKQLGFMIGSKQTRGYLRYLLEWDQLRQGTRANIQCALEHYQEMNTSRK